MQSYFDEVVSAGVVVVSSASIASCARIIDLVKVCVVGHLDLISLTLTLCSVSGITLIPPGPTCWCSEVSLLKRNKSMKN